MIKYFIGQSALTKYLERDIDIESDCEEDPWGASEETPDAKEEKEEQARAVLITGPFSVYAHFPNPVLVSGEMTRFSVGNLCSSIAVRTRSCSPPSNHRVLTLAWSTYARRQQRQHPRPARRRVFTFWPTW